jgi:hypothetical protein
LVILEIKSELDGVETVLRPMDVKARVVPGVIARERGWKVAAVGLVLVLPDESVTRRAVALMETVFDVALPGRTVAVRRWLRDPDGAIRGLWFLADTPTRRAIRNPGSGGRVVRSQEVGIHAQRGADVPPPGAPKTFPELRSASGTPTRRNCRKPGRFAVDYQSPA